MRISGKTIELRDDQHGPGEAAGVASALASQALAIIDDVVNGNFAAADLATIHGIPSAWIRSTLGYITNAHGLRTDLTLSPAAILPSRHFESPMRE